MSAVSPGRPEDCLVRVAEALRAADFQLAALAQDPAEEPELGLLAASGPRAAATPGDYAFAIEAIREGYLLHYGRPRVARADDANLALLAGDFLYALGLEQLSALGDTEAVAELADLISDCAAIHAGDSDPAAAKRAADERWRASAKAIGFAATQRPPSDQGL